MINSRRSHSLFDMILIAFIISVLSGHILQMFLVAARANSDARDFDMAEATVSSSIEMFKYYNNLDNYLQKAQSSSCLITAGPERSFTIISYYSPRWELLDPNVSREQYPYVFELQMNISEFYYTYSDYRTFNSLGEFSKQQTNLVKYKLTGTVDEKSDQGRKPITSLVASGFYINNKEVDVID